MKNYEKTRKIFFNMFIVLQRTGELETNELFGA